LLIKSDLSQEKIAEFYKHNYPYVDVVKVEKDETYTINAISRSGV